MSLLRRLGIVVLVLALLAAGLALYDHRSSDAPSADESTATTVVVSHDGMDKIQHVVMISQENRSFDSYFGTFPGADGIPMSDGQPTVCNPNPSTNHCDEPYHDSSDVNGGGPHATKHAAADVNSGKMDGFVAQAEAASQQCADPTNPACANSDHTDVMGWHDAREIPNYWTYANDFVLQDQMFEPTTSWSLPAHLFLTSEWSARCTKPGDATSCFNAKDGPGAPPDSPRVEGNTTPPVDPSYAWTDLTYLLHKQAVSWGYYVTKGNEPDCANDGVACTPQKQNARTPGIWNPLPWFTTVQQDGQLANIQDTSSFLDQAKAGTLPSVSWVVPDDNHSEHPPAKISDGQAYVTNLINTIMQGPDWSSTAIFLSWDDWGGFFDHSQPPTVDENGYGLRVPGLVISPYAKQGYIDHQTLSFDAYAKFIEDRFLGGQRLDPATDGRPDRRPTVRDALPELGDLAADFDFTEAPRPPEVLNERPPPGPASQ
jgi:phospholipase C